MKSYISMLLTLFFAIFYISFSQVGIMLSSGNITLTNYETFSSLRIYGSNKSYIEITHREANILDVLSNFKGIIQNFSEQKDCIKIELYHNLVKIESSNDKISFIDIPFVIKKCKEAEPGYRVFYISAREIKDIKGERDYSVAIIPSVEIPILMLVEGNAIRKISILDLNVIYEEKPKISVLVRNDGTVTTSFKTTLNISNYSFSSFGILKPKEVSIIKFPISLVGKYNVTAKVDYYSDFSLEEKELEIKEIYISFEETFVNILPYVIVIASVIIAIILVLKRV